MSQSLAEHAIRIQGFCVTPQSKLIKKVGDRYEVSKIGQRIPSVKVFKSFEDAFKNATGV
jgi:hypothetical protein